MAALIRCLIISSLYKNSFDKGNRLFVYVLVYHWKNTLEKALKYELWLSILTKNGMIALHEHTEMREKLLFLFRSFILEMEQK